MVSPTIAVCDLRKDAIDPRGLDKPRLPVCAADTAVARRSPPRSIDCRLHLRRASACHKKTLESPEAVAVAISTVSRSCERNRLALTGFRTITWHHWLWGMGRSNSTDQLQVMQTASRACCTPA